MNIVNVTKEEANNVNQTKKFGVIMDGACTIWGEGDTIEEATQDAKENMINGCSEANFEDCFIMEIV